jgi:hypothetical protein
LKDSFLNSFEDESRTTKKFKFHKQEICGCAINPLNKNLIATGGNDNLLVVTDIRFEKSLMKLNAHKAAVRGLAWNTRKANFLYTGGGSNDRRLKMWNVNTKSLEKSVYTGSQICEVLYFPDINEVITAHGFSSNNIGVWTPTGLEKIAELSGHSKRVLHCVKTHNSNQILSGSSDQSLRFWDLIPKYDSRYSKECECQNKIIKCFGQCDCFETVKPFSSNDILYNNEVQFGEEGIYQDYMESGSNLHDFYFRKKWNRKCKQSQENQKNDLLNKIPNLYNLSPIEDNKENLSVEESISDIELEIEYTSTPKKKIENEFWTNTSDNQEILNLCSNPNGFGSNFKMGISEFNNYF